MVCSERVDSYSSPLKPKNREPLLTGRRVPTKTESVSESVDKITGDCLRLQFFCMPTKNRQTAPRENRAPMRSGTASAFWTWRRRRLLVPARTPAWTTSRKRRVWERELLYRHFPTRDALIEAVYRTEVEKLAAAEKKFSESLPPIEALRAWMLLFVDYIAHEADHRACATFGRRRAFEAV